ncbi:hypothetical protein [Horticoccus sp. 23ND18S-11]|uniref:hypothetical protein n=1 Tax=Horticoccus sp. 23ND18S-11 TaxID=3391832 RepID=UPI0039C90310
MNSISDLSPTPSSLPTLEASETGAARRLQDVMKGISLTILGSTGEIEAPGSQVSVRLTAPSITPADVPLNEFLQQLDGLQSVPAPALVLGGAVDALADSATALGQAIQQDPPLDAATAAKIAASFEQQALVVERSIRDLIENSTYPNFNDFLKDLVKIAQELREKATEVKMASIQSNYELMIDASAQMLTAANESKASREKQIEADRTEAIGQIVSGCVSLALSVGFGAAGIKTNSVPVAQLGGQIAQGTGPIITGSVGVSVSNLKTESSEAQYRADLADIAKQRLEAAAKLIEAETQIADDLKDLAKGLRDMVLKLAQDFINSQSQVIQRANV